MDADSIPADGSRPGDDQIVYKVPHAAKVLDLSDRQVWELVKKGAIASFKMGASRRILRSDLVAYIERMRAEDMTHPPSGPSSPPPPPGPKAEHNASRAA